MSGGTTQDSTANCSGSGDSGDQAGVSTPCSSSRDGDGASAGTIAKKRGVCGIIPNGSTLSQLKSLAAVKRRRGEDTSDNLSQILMKFVQVSEECNAKRRKMEAELEEKRREQEQKHEERMMTMMMSFMQQMMGFPLFHPPPGHPHASLSQPTPLPSPFPSTSNSHSFQSPRAPFPPTQSFPSDTSHPYFYNNDDSDH